MEKGTTKKTIYLQEGIIMKKQIKNNIKRKALMTGLTALMGVAPMTAMAREANVNVGDEYASYGYSLDANQRENTKRLLNANEVVEENEITMTPETYVSIFGGDPANIGNIYSSAYVQYEDEGHGVNVDIVTPETILQVSEESYINAAITSGMENVNIGIASTVEVTGEGGLAGIYAIQQATGVEVDQEVAQLTNDELALNSELEDEVALDNPDATGEETNALTNGLLADIKAEIGKLAQQNNGGVDEGQARDIVINIVNNYGLNLSDETIQQLVDFATRFSNTEIALSPEMQEQLAQLGNTLKEKGGDIWDGIQSTISDPEFQESAGNLWTSFVNFIKNLFSGIFGGSEATA